ncbi:MAG: biopolymer transporter ExbD [Lautropia sp.]|nr:biopolymer transporter ExbD [Lautropia sp.]
MAFASFDSKNSNSPMGEINMVPLIDVMLVLLVIFIVTAPLLTHSVNLALPRATTTETDNKPPKIDFSIDADGNLFWGSEPISREDAAERFKQAGQENPQPAVHLRADENTPYRYVAQTIVDASKAGLSKVGFISKPEDQE